MALVLTQSPFSPWVCSSHAISHLGSKRDGTKKPETLKHGSVADFLHKLRSLDIFVTEFSPLASAAPEKLLS